MNILKEKEYNKAIIERIKLIIELTGLEIAGFSILTTIKENLLYSILSGRRKLSKESAHKIGLSLNFEGSLIFNLYIEIPQTIKKSENLRKFYSNYKENLEYYTHTKNERKPSHFIENELLENDFLLEPRYVWEINNLCEDLGKSFISDKLKKHLNYLVVKNKLKSEKRHIKLRNGKFGKRMVDVFWKPM